MLTAQEIFDKVALHLATQNRKSVNTSRAASTACAYRGNKGTSCAIGCLIPDSQYRPEFDSVKKLQSLYVSNKQLFDRFLPRSTAVVYAKEYLPFVQALRAGGVDVHEHLDLLGRLQQVHDDANYECGYTQSTVDALQRVAEFEGLDATNLPVPA